MHFTNLLIGPLLWRRHFDGFQVSGLVLTLPEVLWAVAAGTHLAWKPRKSWDLALEHLQSQPGVAAVTWEHFVLFMERSLASLLPVHETRQRYDRLRQARSVRDLVHEASCSRSSVTFACWLRLFAAWNLGDRCSWVLCDVKYLCMLVTHGLHHQPILSREHTATLMLTVE